MKKFGGQILKLLFTVVIISSCQPSRKDNQSLPNIVLIFADDLGYGDLSCYGHPTIHTPYLDQMAQEGIRFTSFYAAASVCSPSRAALLTGRYPLRVGQPGNLGPDSKGGLSKDEELLSELLRTKGYRTTAIGKWHLGAVPGYMPTDRGFDTYFGLLYSNDMMPPWVNTKRPLQLYENDQPLEEQPVDQTTLTKRYTNKAVQSILEKDNRPFFIYLAHSMPHLPVYASKAFQGTSQGGRYGDVIEELDASVGRILETLEKEGLDKNTLVIFTSDNGPWRNMPPRMYNTDAVEKWHGGTTGPLFGAKATSYEGGHRVPAIFRWPGQIKPRQVTAKLATTMDIFATIKELCGLETSEKTLDGKNIWPLLTEGSVSPHDYFYYFRGRYLDGIRSDEWKLRAGPPTDGWTSPELLTGEEEPVWELYNLKNDPFEKFNLINDNEEVAQQLIGQIKKMSKETGAIISALTIK